VDMIQVWLSALLDADFRVFNSPITPLDPQNK
jgi:hypothetical protein